MQVHGASAEQAECRRAPEHSWAFASAPFDDIVGIGAASTKFSGTAAAAKRGMELECARDGRRVER